MHFKTQSILISFLALTLVLPVNIYTLGDAIGAALQFPFLRYQETYLGTSVITVFRDLDYVTSGTITGRSALSILLQLCGTSLLIAAIVYFAARRQENYESFKKPLALLVGGAGGAYLLSCLIQYGPLLHGPAGFAVPVGVPLILAVAWYILRAEDDEDEYNEEDDCGEEAGEEE
ncbi:MULTISPECIES: hypothetical protein [unclassified Methanoculleus]|jgi:hypothetical protein|uniref:hypothetical protein n=1 Tax=unclassified Methanoculleus TaxID=2619537 RepID=UPI00319E5589